MEERLQKIIARAGIASRRDAERLIEEGQVTVNGQIVTELGSRADAEKDHIKVNGKLIDVTDERVYILLNKPKGVVSTVNDPEGRPVVLDLIKGIKTRIYPVGRLDFNTEGAILLTNDGDLANRLLSPKYKCPKTYLVKVAHDPSPQTILRLERGIVVDGARYSRCKIQMLKSGNNSWLSVVLYEGKNHQVRKMFESVGHPVSKLKRVSFGFLGLDGLEPGEHRELTPSEVQRLQDGEYEPKTQINLYRILRDAGVNLTLKDRERLETYPEENRIKQSIRKPNPRPGSSRRVMGKFSGKKEDGDKRKAFGGKGKSEGYSKSGSGGKSGRREDHSDRPRSGKPGRWEDNSDRPRSGKPGRREDHSDRPRSGKPGGKFGDSSRSGKPGGKFGDSPSRSGKPGGKFGESSARSGKPGGKFGDSTRSGKPGGKFGQSSRSDKPGESSRSGKPGGKFSGGAKSGKPGGGKFSGGSKSGKPGGKFGPKSGQGGRSGKFGGGKPGGKPGGNKGRGR